MKVEVLKSRLKRAEQKIVQLEVMIEEAQNEQYIESSENEKLAGFARFNPYPVIRIDNEGVILISNKAANEYFKVSKMRGLFWHDLVDMNRAKVDTSAGRLQFEYNLNGADLLLCYMPIPELGAINIYGFDISLRKKMEKDLEEERARHLHSVKMATLGEMAGGMAHELNSPLGMLNLSIEQIRSSIEGNMINASKDILMDMEGTIHRMAKLISGFKTFSRSSSKGEFSFIDFKPLMEESLEICKMSLKDKGIDFQYPNEFKSLSIECNPTEITQVIMNLIQNSADAIKELNEKWIKLSVNYDDDICISISDAGDGIPKEEQDKIFIPFFTTKEVGKGTGLGLGIIKGIMEKHNGQITLDTDAKNTTFYVKLPLIQSIGEFL